MGIADYYLHGSHNVICDRCGFKFKAHHLRLEWNGLRTCCGAGTNNCFEVRQPQDFVRGKADKQAPDWVRSEPTDAFPDNITPDDL